MDGIQMSSLCYLQAIYLSIFVSYTENKCSQQDVKQTDIILVSREMEYYFLYNNQINAHALIGQSAVVYCAGKPTEKSRDFWILI